MRLALLFILFPVLIAWTSILNLFHAGVMPAPRITDLAPATVQWFGSDRMGIHHMILKGSPYERGLKAGQLTKHLLLEQEQVLNKQLETWLPKKWLRQAAVLGAIGWFYGIDRYLLPEHIEEMYGISKSAPHEYDYLVDSFTRQVAYHGLHEVGQMMVDQGFEAMGCTVVAAKRGRNWVLGRNFDFEGGRIFDKEKIIKWVFPTRGNAFVSVIWAGMVGAVTGVNEKGVYISINAAGSEDFARVGNPSTLVLLQALQEANSTTEAIRILEAAPMFITDIFVVSDRLGNLAVVEKSPKRSAVRKLEKNSVVTNHLLAPTFASDPTNVHRREELTTIPRFKRGQELVDAIPVGFDLNQTVLAVLSILRDKGVDANGRPLALGHRQAIDALIATHSVVYDGVRELLYVGQGPGASGRFLGYDLKRSFKDKIPAYIGALPADPQVSPETFQRNHEINLAIAQAHRFTRKNRCNDAKDILEWIGPQPLSSYYHALGDTHRCLQMGTEARTNWQKALELTPAYAKEERALRRSLGE